MPPLLLMLALAASRCGPVIPATADPRLAAVYLEVGEAALAANDFETAATALSYALSFDETLVKAAALKERACLALGERSLLAVDALMDASRWREALDALELVSQATPGTRALLAAVCHLELGEDDAAVLALERALNDPVHRADARVLLSLVALRRGSARAAEEQLRALEQGGQPLAAPLSALLRRASRGGRLIARASIFGGLDSNPTLTPMAMAATNGLIGFTGLIQFVPLGAIGPYARLGAGGREYPGLPQLRTLTGVGTLGFQLGRGGDRVAVDYSLDGMIFGLEPYGVTHGPRVEGSLQLGPVLLFAEWALRVERFFPAAAAGFSGLRQDAALGASTALPSGFSLEAGWSLTRDGTQQRELAFLDQGPRLSLGWASGRTRAMLGGALDWRGYDVFDPDLGVQREDVRLRPSVRLELDLTGWLSLFAAGDATLIWSNVDVVSAVRFAATGGAQLWAGAW